MMAQKESPDVPRSDIQITDPRTGRLTNAGVHFLDQIWRQVCAGFVSVPCVATGTDAITLTPSMHKEGGNVYADHEIYTAVAAATSTAAVTARVGTLAFIKVYINGGSAQAGVGDIVLGRFYLFCYVQALDAGNGGFVIK
jgi:hypothetical protein